MYYGWESKSVECKVVKWAKQSLLRSGYVMRMQNSGYEKSL